MEKVQVGEVQDDVIILGHCATKRPGSGTPNGVAQLFCCGVAHKGLQIRYRTGTYHKTPFNA